MADAPAPAFQLGDWAVDPAGQRLQRGGEERPLRFKAMALLVLLARHAGQTVPRELIVQALWSGNQFVAPKAINNAVWDIRRALGDDPEAPRYLQTVAKVGYRLIAPVQWVAAQAEAELPAPVPATPPPAVAAAAPAAAAARPRWPWITGALATTALLAGLAWWAWPGVSPSAGPPPTPQVQALTQDPGHEYLGALSPDGRWLAYAWWQGSGEGGLWLKPAVGSSPPPRGLSGDSGEVTGLSWAPDGRALAFATTRGGRCTLWRVDIVDGARHALSGCSPMLTPTVAWSPDGRHIAFSAEAEGAGGLFLIGPQGGTARRLTTAAPRAPADHQPAWSPDGQRLAFARTDPADGSRDLHETTLDGRVQRLSQERLFSLHGIGYAANGQDLVFSTTQQDRRMLMLWQRPTARAWPLGLEGSAPAPTADGRLVFALMRSHVSLGRLVLAGGAPVRLAHSVSSDRSPQLQPGSGRIAFVSQRSGQPGLWVAGPDGQSPQLLSQFEGVVGSPVWAPGGGHLAFLGSCGPARRFGLCLLELSSGQVRPLAADAASYGRPAWLADGRALWVASDRGGRWQLWRFALDGSEARALDTVQPPGRALQPSADGRALIYQPRFANHLQWRELASGSERRLEVAAGRERLVDWALGPSGLVLLTRGASENFLRLDPASGARTSLGSYALGTFPELATFALSDDGLSVVVELSNTGSADLMVTR